MRSRTIPCPASSLALRIREFSLCARWRVRSVREELPAGPAEGARRTGVLRPRKAVRFADCLAPLRMTAKRRRVSLDELGIGDSFRDVLDPGRRVHSSPQSRERLLLHRDFHTLLIRKVLRLFIPRIHVPYHAHPRISRQHSLDALGHRLGTVRYRDLTSVQ